MLFGVDCISVVFMLLMLVFEFTLWLVVLLGKLVELSEPFVFELACRPLVDPVEEDEVVDGDFVVVVLVLVIAGDVDAALLLLNERSWLAMSFVSWLNVSFMSDLKLFADSFTVVVGAAVGWELFWWDPFWFIVAVWRVVIGCGGVVFEEVVVVVLLAVERGFIVVVGWFLINWDETFLIAVLKK